MRQGRGARSGARDGLTLVGLAGYERAPAQRAVGRPAAARRGGARAGAGAAGAAVRRAAVQPRRPAAPPDARGDPRAAAAARPHRGLRHPRPGGGAGGLRPHHRHERRPHRAAGQPARALRAAGNALRRPLHGRVQSGCAASCAASIRRACACGWATSRSISPIRPPPTAKPRSRSARSDHGRSGARPGRRAGRHDRQGELPRHPHGIFDRHGGRDAVRHLPAASSGRWRRATRSLSSCAARCYRLGARCVASSSSLPSWPPPARRRRRPKSAAGAAAARPLPRLVVEARGAAADGQRQDLDGAAGGRRMGALRPADHHLFGRRAAAHRAARRQGARGAASASSDYWESVGHPERSGLDDVPWSAAFISWDIESAGVPRDLFCPDQRHTIYVERMVERARRPGAAFIPHRPDERAPQVGDLICASRDGSGTTLENLNRGAGHCDHRGRGAARRGARDRRQCGRLGQPQRLSTGRQRVFVAHIRPALFHRDREHDCPRKNENVLALRLHHHRRRLGRLRHRQPPRRGSGAAHPDPRGRARPTPPSCSRCRRASPASARSRPTTGATRPTPQKHCNDRRMYWPRGKTLGGSSSINAMLYVRGHASDYDHWRQLGNEGWSYDDVLPYFKKAENNERGADDFHGAGGPLNVADQADPVEDQRGLPQGRRAGRPQAHRRLQRRRAGRRRLLPGDAEGPAALEHGQRLSAAGRRAQQEQRPRHLQRAGRAHHPRQEPRHGRALRRQTAATRSRAAAARSSCAAAPSTRRSS